MISEEIREQHNDSAEINKEIKKVQDKVLNNYLDDVPKKGLTIS